MSSMTSSFRSRFVSLALTVTLIGAGCGGPTGPEPIADPFPKEKVTLTVWRPFAEQAPFTEAARSYRQIHPNVTIAYQAIDPAQYETKLLNALAAKTGPDIFSVPNDALTKFQGVLEPMPAAFFHGSPPTTVLSAQYAPATTTDLMIGDRVYAIPFFTDSLAVFWNRDIFRKALVEYARANTPINQDLLVRAPADWNEVVEVTKLLTKRSGDQLELSAIALGTSVNVPHASDIVAALMMQQGAQMVTTDRRAAAFHLADQADPSFYPGAAVLDFLHGFTNPGSSYYTWNSSQPEAIEAFLTGKVAMMLNYQSVVDYLKQRNPTLDYATAPLPQIAGTKTILDLARYHAESVNKDSPYKLVAWDFLRHFSEGQYLSTIGRPRPTRVQPASTTVLERRFRTDPFQLQIATAQSWFKGKDPVAADQVVAAALDRVALHNQPSRDSLNQAATELTELLSGP